MSPCQRPRQQRHHWDLRGADRPRSRNASRVVDAERDVLLRCASRLGGEDFAALEVEEIHFDQRFDEDTFASRDPLPWR